MGQICKLIDVKSRLRLDIATYDAALTDWIHWTQGKFEGALARKLERSTAAEFEFEADRVCLFVDRYPIESVTGFDLKTDEAGGWVAVSPVPSYVFELAAVIRLASPLGSAAQRGRVRFTGGYSFPSTIPVAGAALPAAIEQSAIEQVAYWFQNRDRLGITSVFAPGGSITQHSQLDLLPAVRAAIQPYRRMQLV